jgi:hypothetical protein
MISHKMIERSEPYRLALKGGKAIQIVLSETDNPPIYESEDIDLLLLPTHAYNREEIKRVAGHLAYLMKWFLEIPLLEKKVSVLGPDDPASRNQDLYKLSYHITAARAFKAFSDIDFNEVPKESKKYYAHLMDFHKFIPVLEEEITFYCPILESLLDEKLFYFSKFFVLSYLEDKEGYTLDDCIRYRDKFKRAIVALNKGMQSQKYPGISPQDLYVREVDFVVKRLNKMDIPGIGPALVQGLLQQNEHIPGIDRVRRDQDVQLAKEHIVYLMTRSIYP